MMHRRESPLRNEMTPAAGYANERSKETSVIGNHTAASFHRNLVYAN